MSEPPLKDRKKSAHWTDADTDTLVNVLLRYKDTGRTADNGFKPEVWREASNRLEGATVIGGPKTPEACKSRWQRVSWSSYPSKSGAAWHSLAHGRQILNSFNVISRRPKISKLYLGSHGIDKITSSSLLKKHGTPRKRQVHVPSHDSRSLGRSVVASKPSTDDAV